MERSLITVRVLTVGQTTDTRFITLGLLPNSRSCLEIPIPVNFEALRSKFNGETEQLVVGASRFLSVPGEVESLGAVFRRCIT
jgi:hypothetical protein